MSRLRQFWRDLDDPAFVIVGLIRLYLWTQRRSNGGDRG